MQNLHKKCDIPAAQSLELEYNLADFIAELPISKQTPRSVHDGQM